MNVPLDTPDLLDTDTLDRQLAAGADPLPLLREALDHANQGLERRFEEEVPVYQLVTQRARVVDAVVCRAWEHAMGPQAERVALVAVGGYGRGELHPHSDVDLMALVPEVSEDLRPLLEGFLQFLWDVGLEVGHSVRTVADCIEQGARDITIATNLMESRLLHGPEDLYQEMRARTGPDHIWPSRDFFEAKWREQLARHHKFDDTAYNLEPNIKEGPGGLRDIQMVGWVAKRHFHDETLKDLVERGFLTAWEYKTLIEGQNFLWKVRFGLHILAGRREDRLLFDYQRTLAARFGYRDGDHYLGVERFMKRYYRTVMELRRLNEVLLQLYQEAILYADESGEPVPINKRFQARKGFIEVRHPAVFEQYPFALLELFLLMAQHTQLKGVRAETIRLLLSHRYLIDDEFRDDSRCRTLFMELLRQPRGITHELRRMNRYGVLAAYLPSFGRVVGQMQHDLFHVYTVDEHTLFVVRNLRRFTVPEFEHEFPSCSRISRRIPKPEVLYIAALFHDIAKGRGGDHSELGAEEVIAFCRHHYLSEYDTHLAAWLVRNHLLMSVTAQRQDTSDPEVINAFAARVGNPTRLDYLYLLTVADIRGTSPSLWNSWKDALLAELYQVTRHALRRGLANPLDQEELVADTQGDALQILGEAPTAEPRVRALWQRLSDEYFLRYSADEVAWHAQSILENEQEGSPLVVARPETHRGGTEIFIYAPIHEGFFSQVTSTLDQMGLDIVDARVIASTDGYTLDTYIVLEQDGTPAADGYRINEIREALRERLSQPAQPPVPVRRQPDRQLRHFSIPTAVRFEQDERNDRTVMEVVTTDRPGVLSSIARAMYESGVRLQTAKIATFGERVEDIFLITDATGGPVTDPARLEQLHARVTEHLEE